MKSSVIFAIIAIMGARAFKLEHSAMPEAEAEFAAAEAETRWRREASPAIALASTTLSVSGAHLECHSVQPFKSEAVDGWCDINCNHVPSFCPESHCACQQEVTHNLV